MPPTRRTRTSGGPAPKGSQKTISFGASKSSKAASKDLKASPSPSPFSSTPSKDIGHTSSEAAVAQQAAVELARVKKEEERTPEEVKAAKVTDAQIKRYWRERENERRTPRVHQESLSVEEKILRLWDMSSQYGVSLPSQLGSGK
jgi:DNA polymerase delta subunit 4